MVNRESIFRNHRLKTTTFEWSGSHGVTHVSSLAASHDQARLNFNHVQSLHPRASLNVTILTTTTTTSVDIDALVPSHVARAVCLNKTAYIEYNVNNNVEKSALIGVITFCLAVLSNGEFNVSQGNYTRAFSYESCRRCQDIKKLSTENFLLYFQTVPPPPP